MSKIPAPPAGFKRVYGGWVALGDSVLVKGTWQPAYGAIGDLMSEHARDKDASGRNRIWHTARASKAVTTPVAAAAPRWRVYPKEKPTGKGSIYIAHVKDGAIVEIDCATGSFYRNMAALKNLSTATMYWPYWMPVREALSLFPAIPAAKP